MKEYGIGMIGFGFMGKAHTYGYKTIPLYYENIPFRTRLMGVCTAHQRTAEKARDLNGFAFAATDPDELFSHKDIDMIHICTPNAFHKETVIKALKAGKHVYCEKPLTTSYADALEILDVLDSHSDLVTQMTFQNRFFPAVIRAKQLISEGRLGKILSFHAAYLHSGSVDPNKPIGWKQDSAQGGGVLFDLGSHVLDLIYYLIGEYHSILASNTILYPRRPAPDGSMVDITAEDQSLMIVKMKNQSSGTLEISKIATGTNDELRFEIYGDKGAVKFNLMDPSYLDFYDNTKPDQPIGGEKGFTRIETVQRFPAPGGMFVSPKASIGWIRGHVHSLYNFLTCVHEGRQADPSIRDGAYIQYVMEKAHESNKKACWITL